MSDNPDVQYCSRLSLQAGEPLFGTAGQAEVYFLLEYNGAYDSKALEGSAVPEQVKNHLHLQAKNFPTSKTLLIKQGRPAGTSGIRFFVAVAREAEARLYSFLLPGYEALLDLDLAGILHGEPAFQGNLVAGPLILVCTNGRRDPCCARYGVPLYQALQRLAGGAVWECSHVGGHRFAPNLYHLPAGILYGRLAEAEAPALLAALQAGEIYLSNLRGRTAYTPAAQAAEYYLRQQTGELALDAYQLVNIQEPRPGAWQVQFQAAGAGQVYDLLLEVESTPGAVYESCALDKQTTLVKHRRTEP